MSWEDRFSSIVKETESNLSRVRDRLGSSTTKRMSSTYYAGPSGSRAASNYLAGSHGNMRPTVSRYSSTPGKPSQSQDFERSINQRSLSPVRTAGLSSGVQNNLSSQMSPALVNALFERVEQQAEVISSVSEAVKTQERTQRSQAGEMKRMQDEITRLNDRLREKGVDLETERKLEQFKREMFGQLEMVQSRVRIQKSADDDSLYQRRESGDAAALVKDLHESKRILQDDNESLRREFDQLRTRLTKLELEQQPTVSDMQEMLRRQDRLDRTVGSLTESQRSQSRSLSSVADDRDVYYRDLRQLRNAVDKLSRQFGELESDFSQNSLSKPYQGLHPSVSNGSLSDRGPKKPTTKNRSLRNGDMKPKKKQRKYKSTAADALLELGLSDSDTDLSLTTLDLSSASDSELTSVQLNKSIRDAGLQLDNLSSTSLSSLDSDNLLGASPH